MDSWSKTAFWLTTTVLSCLANVYPASAAPSGSRDDDDLYNVSHPFAEFGVSAHRARDTSIPLRILGLGASIMSGTGSSTGNGLRKPLRDALRQDGWEVDMVGSLHGGTMVDYEHEAVPGDVLTQVLARVPHSTGYKPNIVIINAGTNDAVRPVDPSTAGDRMNNVLNALWDADGMSDTCIMVSTLIPTTNTNGVTYQGTINDQYRALVPQRAAEGKCIYLAEMWPLGDSDQWFQFDTDYLATESPHVHPNDKGHSMMASVFYNAIQSAISDNRLVTPGDMVVGASVCDKVEGTGVDAGGLTQRGSGYDDGIYYHDSTEEGILWSAVSDWDNNQWKFARLFNRNYDDLIAWMNTSDTDSQVYAVWANSADGKGSFTQINAMDGDLDCRETAGVNFIDMNGDGLDDLVYIDEDGNAYLSINQGDGDASASKPPTFKRVSDTAKIMDAKGSFTRAFVVLADIDGDGRGDYGTMDYDGNVKFWRNGGAGDSPAYWQSLGTRYTGNNYETDAAAGENEGTRFEDINGDGRDDMVWLDKTGAGHLWTNDRSCKKGVEGNGLNVAWREGYYHGTTDQAFKGMSAYVTKEETNLRGRVHFARIYGEATIFGNLPTQDYVFMQHTDITGGYHKFQMRVWKNTGGGATKLKADGDKYCNMMGHSDGMADYVWTYSFGNMEMWANRGKSTISDSDPDGYWDYQGAIWTPPSHMNRKDLHLQDWDGDGDCDIIYANPDTGAVTVWINNYPTTKSWSSWEEKSYPSLTCEHHRGLGINDLAVRFADISGNGFADYLCIAPDSTVHGYVHAADGSFSDLVQLKVSIGKDRANLRWADVNGDGLDDMLWIEKFSGDTYVYYNDGPQDPTAAAGSSFGWTKQDDPAYAGLAAGTCLHFVDIDGDGFADEHYILQSFNNIARTSLAPGCGLTDKTGDDADMSSDLPLPTVPGSGGTGSGGTGSGGTGSGSGNSTGEGCVSGTGDGGYADLCGYACARGYCPDPCTCDSTGTYDAGTADTIITGYAAPGFDQATYSPLCNFTCTHGYCPDECVSTVDVNPSLTDSIPPLPTLADYYDENDATYAAGDFFRYQFADDPDVSLSVLYAGSATNLPTDMVCDDVTPGPNGDFLGCVGETVEWLMLSLAEDPNAITSRDTPSRNHTFAPLAKWQPEHNCSTHCQLQAHAPLKTWIPVGNGTINGRARSLHFMHTGQSLVYKATAGPLAETADLEKRVVPIILGALAVLSIGTNAALFTQISDPNKRPIIAKHVSHAAMDAAADKYLETCVFVTVNESSLVDVGTAPTGFGVVVGTSSALAVDTDEADGLSTTCENEVPNTREYIIWPSDGNDVDSLRTQLLGFDSATDEHVSVNPGYGTMYFRSFLTMAQADEVTQNKQAMEVEAKCTNDCPDPTLFSVKTKTKASRSIIPTKVKTKSGTDMPSKVRERDGLWTTQDPAVPELAFISQPSGSSRATYVYDATAAKRVRVYLLDAQLFDTSLSEFTTAQDSTGQTIQQKTTVVSIGRNGWSPTSGSDGINHGTAMLALAAGSVHGIARESVPYVVTFDFSDTRAWVIDALDDIERDWRASVAAGTVDDIGVLGMMFGFSRGYYGGMAFERYFANRLKALEALNLLGIAASGNAGQPVNTVPAILGNSQDSDYVPNLLVVGAVDNAGAVWEDSDYADWISLYAPGVDISAPYRDPTTGDEEIFTADGTSGSGAKVVGLAAYFLGLPDLASDILDIEDLRSLLLETGYVRQSVRAIYNDAPA